MMLQRKIRRLGTVLSDSRWWGFYLQRRVMNPVMREWLARRVAGTRPATTGNQTFESSQRSVQELRTSGISMLGQLLDSRACEDLRQYFLQKKVHDPYRLGSVDFLPLGEERHPDAHIAHHRPQDILRAPHLVGLANDPRILDVVGQFLGCKPTLGYLAAWWSYHTPKGAQQAEFFHRDVDDWKFVKLFVYLTDVGSESGPHVYVRSSSSSQKLAEIRRFSDDEVRQAFGADNVMTMTATAGQGFLEDTFGIHKGQPVAHGTRLIFQAVYGISPLPYGPKEPVLSRKELGMPALDPWINRAYIT